MKYVSIPLKEYLIEPSFSMCTDCVLFSEDYLNLYAADVATFVQAKDEFKAVLDIIPDLEEGQYNYAIMCYKMGQFKQALENFRKYSSAFPKDLQAKKMITLLE